MDKTQGVRGSRGKRWVAVMFAGGLAVTAPSLFAQAEGQARSAKLPPKQAEAPPLRTKPDIRLEKRMKAKEAVKELKRQGKLEGLAKYHQRTPQELEKLMNTQADMYVDKDGSLLFIEMDTAEPDAAMDTDPNVSATYPLDQTFFLNSKPKASKTIYLNFKGKTLTGTAWNSSYATDPIQALPFDEDSTPGSFSISELTKIQTIWKGVSESFAPFDVNVTTQEPPRDKITRSSSSDIQFGTEVLITKNFTVDLGKSCGCSGYAYIGVFDMAGDYYKPAMVFANTLGFEPHRIMGTTSHEIGHNLGLYHDGIISGTAYYAGHGTGTTSWSTIMGNSRQRNVIQWSKGEYPNANNTEDDLQIIQANGLSYDQDDHGNSLTEATPLNMTPTGGLATFAGQGIISTSNDTDAFSLRIGAGPLSISLKPAFVRPRLDTLLSLYDPQGNLLAQDNPFDALSSSLTYTAPSSGTYWLTVTGTGKAAAGTDYGYSNYASFGHYSFTASAALPPVNQNPTASFTSSATAGSAPLTISFDASGSKDSDGSIQKYLWNFGDGTQSSGVKVSKTFNSPGEFPVTLQVTDDANAIATVSTAIQIDAPVIVNAVHIEGMTLSKYKGERGANCAVGQLRIFDQGNKPMAGVSVKGSFSGVLSATWTGKTDSLGNVTANAGCTKTRGTLRMGTDEVIYPNYLYDSGSNKANSVSVTF